MNLFIWPGIKRKSIFIVVFLCAFLMHSESGEIKRADFYDASGNHLMYVELVYNEQGKNTERNVYMADGTFKRRTVLVNNSSGNREKEVSFDFNDDTCFATTLKKDGDRTKFSVFDQFRVDQFDGEVSYSESGDLVDVYQKGSLINKMKYIKEGNSYARIEVYDNASNLLNYVTLKDVSARQVKIRPSSMMSVQQQGNNRLFVKLSLHAPSTVFCELISLSGKRVATLFTRNMFTGEIAESINLGSAVPGLATGVYLINMSIDGKRVYRDKILVKGSGKGY